MTEKQIVIAPDVFVYTGGKLEVHIGDDQYPTVTYDGTEISVSRMKIEFDWSGNGSPRGYPVATVVIPDFAARKTDA